MSKLANIGRYDVVAEIGRGAMGVVYRAFDPLLDRTVAIKTIGMAIDLDEIEFYEKRFLIEARAAGGLNHPSIVTIHDIGRCGDMAYMAMEFLDGRELKDLITNGELTLDRALDIAAQVADGLAYAHERGVIHRDIKPGNIMIIGDGRAKITDFGIARMHSADVRTQTGILLGSPRYLAPEQVLGRSPDSRVDVFSLGVILHEMLTGRSPFNGPDIQSVMYQVIHHTPASPSSINPALPPMLDLIVARAMAKSPDDRYASAADMAADLMTCREQCAGAADLRLPARGFPPSQTGGDGRLMPGERMVARGLAREFDSTAATVRLAAWSGAIGDPDSFAATVGVSRQIIDAALKDAGPAPVRVPSAGSASPPPPWSAAERKGMLIAVFIALGVAALLFVL